MYTLLYMKTKLVHKALNLILWLCCLCIGGQQVANYMLEKNDDLLHAWHGIWYIKVVHAHNDYEGDN